MDDVSPFASRSVARHLARGVLGFGSLGLALFALPTLGAAALVFLVLGVVALRGCPLCWIVGLAETLSRGRVRGDCAGTSCTLTTTRQISTD